MSTFNHFTPPLYDRQVAKNSFYHIFLSVVLSFAAVLMTRVQFSGTVSGTADQNYFSRFGVSAVVLFLFLLTVLCFIIPFLDSRLYNSLEKLCSHADGQYDRPRVIRFWGILIAAAWLPYYLSYYPGGIYSDTFTSVSYCLSGTVCNRHPLFYNALIGLAIRFGNLFHQDLEWSMGLFLAAQMLLLEIEILYFLHWMLVHHISHRIYTCIMLFMIFFPLMPLYAVSVWKDTPFSMAFLFWFLFTVDLYLNIRRQKWHAGTLAGFILGMFLVAFTRNNGIYVVLATTVLFLLLTFTFQFQKKLVTYGAVLLSALTITFRQGPVYRHAGVIPTDVVEDIGIPIQQICSVVVHDGKISQAQKESIDRFIPYENIPEYFKPCVVDSIKWSAGMDWWYLELHKAEFWDLWKHLFLQNPQIYLEEYLLETLGFWNVDVSGPNGYVQTHVWSNDYGLTQTDWFERLTGFSFQHFVNPRSYISCAWFFWLFFICGVFVMKHYGFRNCFLFVPQMAVWLTLMIATPLAVSLRYIAPLLFTLPFIILIPVLLEKETL